MATVIQIWNMALAEVGNNPVASLNEQSSSARQCAIHYEQVRDEVLQAYPWGCASKRETLALVGEGLVTNWQYAYGYPSDCLRSFGLVPPGLRNPTLAQTIPCEVATLSDVRVILTDASDPELLYAWQQADTTQFSALLTRAIYLLLAARIAYPLTKKLEITQKCEQGYLRAVSEAAQSDMNESNPGPAPEVDYITVRY